MESNTIIPMRITIFVSGLLYHAVNFTSQTIRMKTLNNLIKYLLLPFFILLFISCQSSQTNSNIVRFGICSDVHKDIMHDADERLASFITEASERDLDFIIQLGDFVRPYAKSCQWYK